MEKKKRKVNVVDVFIVIIAIILVAAFAFFATGAPKREEGVTTDEVKDTTIKYTLSVENFTEEFKDLIKVGEEIRNVDFDCEVGKVVAVAPAEPMTQYNYSETEGKMVKSDVPGKYKCLITVESECAESENNYYIGAIQLKVGKSMSFKTPGYTFKGIVMSIEGGEKK